MPKEIKNSNNDYKKSWAYGQMSKEARKSNGGSNNFGCNGDGSYTNKGFQLDESTDSSTPSTGVSNSNSSNQSKDGCVIS